MTVPTISARTFLTAPPGADKCKPNQRVVNLARTRAVLSADLGRAVEGIKEDDKTYKIRVAVSSDTPIDMMDYAGAYKEILSHAEGAADLSWARSGDAPMHFYGHNATQTHGASGHCGNIANPEYYTRDDGVRQILVDLVFYKGDETDELAVKRIQSGKLRNVSVGYSIPHPDSVSWRRDPVSGEEYMTVHNWRVDEVTLCSLPVDKQGSGIGRDGSRDRYATISRSSKGDTPMTQENQNPETRSGEKPFVRTPEFDAAVRDAVAQAQREGTSGSDKNKDGKTMEDKDMKKSDTPDAERSTSSSGTRIDGGKFLRLMRAQGVTVENQDKFVGELTACRSEGEANTLAMGYLAGLASPNKPETRSAAVLTGKGGEYNLGRAIQQVLSGRAVDGLEGEMMTERCEKTGRTLASNEMLIPLMGMAGSSQFRASLNEQIRLRAAARGRTIEAGSANQQNGFLTPDFSETDVIHALFPKSGILELVSTFPFLLNQDMKVPVEIGTAEAQWVTETQTRSNAAAATASTAGDANTHPSYTTTKEWNWREVTITIPITRRMLDQTSILYDRVVQVIGRDIPRALNRAIFLGTGANGQPTGLLKMLEDATGSLAATSFGTGYASNNPGGAMTWAKVNKLKTDLQDRDIGDMGEVVYFTNSTVVGAGMTIATFDQSNGQPIFFSDGGVMRVRNDARIVHDNHIPRTYNGNKGRTGGTFHPLLAVIPSLIKLGYFGDVTMIVDPYSKKGTGIIELQPRLPVDITPLYDELVAGALDVTA